MVKVTTPSSKAEIEELVRNLPGILSGRLQDVGGVGKGFRARIAFALMGKIAKRFKLMGRGNADINGQKWAELSKEYLAYGRPWRGKNKRLPDGRRVPQGGKRAGGSGDDGLLTKSQDKRWWKLYREALAGLVSRHPLAKAKGIAAAHAWTVIKSEGGKTKIDHPGLGGRKIGQYQILKNNGDLELSLTQGELAQDGPAATYKKPTGQIFRQPTGQIIVGSGNPNAGFHHFGKGRRKRLLWPEPIPDVWWDDILKIAISGLGQIGILFQQGTLQ